MKKSEFLSKLCTRPARPLQQPKPKLSVPSTIPIFPKIPGHKPRCIFGSYTMLQKQPAPDLPREAEDPTWEAAESVAESGGEQLARSKGGEAEGEEGGDGAGIFF